MNKIIISKKDETLLNFSSSDTGILREISEFFTFMAEGYRYMPAYRNKMWDGKVRLANLRDNTLPFGLLQHLYTFAKSRDYELVLDKSFSDRDFHSKEDLLSFVKSLKLTSRGKKIEPRDYQIEGFIKAIQDGRSLLISPTGSGKSLMIYLMLRWYLEHHDSDKMVLIIVPTTSLVSQMKKDFMDYSEFDDSFDGESEVHGIFAGQEKHPKTLEKFRIDFEDGTYKIFNRNDRIKLKDKKIVYAYQLKEDNEICDDWLKKTKITLL